MSEKTITLQEAIFEIKVAQRMIKEATKVYQPNYISGQVDAFDKCLSFLQQIKQ